MYLRAALVTKYRKRFRVRFSIELTRHSRIEVPGVDCEKLSGDRVEEIGQFCKLPEEAESLMRAAMTRLNLAARAYHRTRSVKLARTIADLAGREEIQSVHLAEALHATQPPKVDVGLVTDHKGDTLAGIQNRRKTLSVRLFLF